MSTLSKNILFNLVGQGLVAFLGFWGTRIVFHRLGDEALGILYFALALNTVVTPLVDLGVSSTVVRGVACHLNGDREYVVRLAQAGALFYWCAYAVLAACIWAIAPWLVYHWIHLSSLKPEVAVLTLRFLGLALLLMLPRSLYSNMLRGVERMEFNTLVDVAMTAIRQGGTIVVVMFGGGLVGIAYFYLGCFLVNVLAYMVAAARFFPLRAFRPGFSRDVVRHNAKFTSRVGAYTVLSVVQMESDKAIMSKLVSVGLLGFYGFAQTMVVRANQIPGAVIQAAFPRLSSLFHEGDQASFRHEYRRLQDLVCYSMVPIFAGVVFAARPLFAYLLNADAARILFVPTLLLCLGYYMNGTLNMPAIVSLAADRPEIGARQNFYALFVVTPITFLLIWKWGLNGASFSVVFYHLYAYSYGARRVASECLGMPALAWYLHVAKVLAVGVASYGVPFVVLNLTLQPSVFGLTVGYFIGSVAYACASYLAVGEELRGGLDAWRGKAVGGVLRYISSN